MPAFTMPGLSSGQNTNEIVKKLVELEAKPIKRWEKENNFGKVQVKILNDLKGLTANLQSKTKALVSFTAPLASKKIVSSDPGVVTGEASRSARSGNRKFEILELATKNQISGNKIESSVKIPAGKFSILSKDLRAEIEFDGGTLNALLDKIKMDASRIVGGSLTRVDSENAVLSLTSILTGEEAKIKLLDPQGVLKAAGLVGDNTPEPQPKIQILNLNISSATAFQPEKFTNSPKPEFKSVKSESGLLMKQTTAFNFPLDKIKVEKNSFLELEITDKEKLPEQIGVGVVFQSGNEDKTKFESVPVKNGKFSLPLSAFAKDKTISSVILSNDSVSDIQMGQVKLVTPGDVVGALPANTIVEAKDAKLKIDGIEIKRDKNEDVKDILDGVSLNFNKITTNPVTVNIETDSEKGLAMIKEFITAYNELVKYAKEATTVNREGKFSDVRNSNENDPNFDIAGSFWDNKNKSGILAGDNSVLRLVAGLRSVISASYPSSIDPGYKVLSDIGISTGAVGSNFKQIQDGLLQIDEEVLKKALGDNSESVRELFASDNNSDSRMDDGVGIQVLEHIKPYTQYTAGVFTSKIKFAEDLMTDNTKKIKNYESHLSGYEKKLKTKFMYMEQGVGRNKAVGDYLHNNLKAGKD